nr:unnamed protein product [Digitaria exilis]
MEAGADARGELGQIGGPLVCPWAQGLLSAGGPRARCWAVNNVNQVASHLNNVQPLNGANFHEWKGKIITCLVWNDLDGDTNLNVAIRDNKVILVPADPKDETQQWFKDYRDAGYVTDDEDQRAYSLVNKATGEVMVNKHTPREDGNIEVRIGKAQAVM